MAKSKQLNKMTNENTGSTGICFKNPTHLEECREAANQSELVSMLHDSRYNIPFGEKRLTVDYLDEKQKVKPVPGVTKLKNMSYEQMESIENIINAVLRLRPRTYRIHMIFGDYEEKKEIKVPEARFINQLNKPRSTKEVADNIAKIIANKNHRIVELDFSIRRGSFADGSFNAILKTWATSEDEWDDESKEHPFLEVDYFGTR